MAVTVRDNPDKSRYEVEVDGAPAGFVEYHLHRELMAMTHTEILGGFEGQGLASQLIGQALDDARKRGFSVQPFCPFVRNYIVKHPAERDLVPRDEWERFDLADS
jgi:uncharacterized protein